MEHFARRELEREFWEPLLMEGSCPVGLVVSFMYFWSSPKEGLDWSFFKVIFLKVVVLGFLRISKGKIGTT